MRTCVSCTLGLALVFGLFAAVAWGEDGLAAGVKVVSEKNPDMSTPEAILASIFKPGMTDQQKAEAIFFFLVTHLYHHNAPEEPSGDRLRKYSGEVTKVMDTVKALNVYGHAICGSQSWYVNFLANAAGFKGRIGGVDGHTVPEIKYDNLWHLFDVDQMGFVRRKDGTVPSVDEIAKDKSLLLEKHDKTPEIYFKYDKPEGEWACLHVGLSGTMFGRKVSSHSMNLTLREGETFTRYFTRQWGPKFRYYASPWVGSEYNARLKKPANAAGGPVRDLTYFLFKEGKVARFGNWELVYAPPLAKKSALAGIHALTNVAHSETAPHLKPEKPDAPSEVVYNYYSPYGCAGCPNDLSKPEDDSDGAILEGEFANDNGTVSCSLDLGKSWQEAHKGGGKFKLDLTPQLETQSGWWIKLAFQGEGAGVKAYKSYFSGQLAPASLPFVDGKTKMTFSRSDTDCLHFRPDITVSDAELKRLAHEVVGFASFSEVISGHVAFKPSGGAVIFKVDAPGELVRVQAGGMFGCRKPSTLNGIEFSIDDGKTWVTACQQPVASEETDHNEEHWMQCVDGTLDFAQKKAYSLGCTPGKNAVRESAFEPQPAKSVLVKYFTKSGNGSFIRCDGIYALYKKPGGIPLTITHKWKGGEHVEKIAASENSKTYEVNGGPLASNESLKFEAGGSN